MNSMFKKKIIHGLKISVIVSVDDNGGIAKNNKIPWSIKEDSHFFHDVTTGFNTQNKINNGIIMGKNSWLNLPDKYRGLPNRQNIILSSSMNYLFADVLNTSKSPIILARTLDHSIKIAEHLGLEHVYICGGNKIYEEVIKKYYIDNLYLTHISYNYHCDTFFVKNASQKIKNVHSNPITNIFLLKNKYHQQSEIFLLTDTNTNIKRSVKFIKYCANKYQSKNNEESEYIKLLTKIINCGDKRETRNGTTYSLFGEELKFDLSHGYPLLTTKKISLRNIFHELMFFIRGQTNTKILQKNGVRIWDQNTSRNFLDSVGLYHLCDGDMGELYGFQWRHFGEKYTGCNEKYRGFDQLMYCINLILSEPFSRRIVMTTFNPSSAKNGCLFPCHGVFIQFYCKDSKLSCMVTQRSADAFLGLPYNIASYAMLVNMICHVVNNKLPHDNKLMPGELIISMGDVHLYESHYSQAIRQILRDPKEFPKLEIINTVSDIEKFEFSDIKLHNYVHYPNIKAAMIA